MDKARILIVEDEILIARDLQYRLQEMGYDVLDIAGTGEEALGMVESLKPGLVLMDIRLRGDTDGIQVAEIVRRKFHTPVIYLTAYADDTTVERAKITEPFGYILKPFQDRELETSIEIAIYKHGAEHRIAEAHRQLQQAHDRLSRQFKELQGRDRLVQFQMNCHDRAAAKAEILQVVSDVTGARAALLYEPDVQSRQLELTLARGSRSTLQPTLALQTDDHIAVHAFTSSEPRLDSSTGAVAAPIIYGDSTIAVVWVGDFEEDEENPEDVPHILWRLAQQAALLLRMARVTEALETDNVPISELLELEAETSCPA